MFARKSRFALLLALVAMLLSSALVKKAQAASSRDVAFTLQAPHGTYTAYLFRTGAAWPTATVPNIQPAGGIVIRFVGIPTGYRYFVRVVNRDSGDTRQPGDFYLDPYPWWRYEAGTVSFW